MVIRMIVEIKFDPEFASLIDAGKKSVTFRRGRKGNEGDIFWVGDEPYMIVKVVEMNLPSFILDHFTEDGFEHISVAYQWFSKHYNTHGIANLKSVTGYAHYFVPVKSIDKDRLVRVFGAVGWETHPTIDEEYMVIKRKGISLRMRIDDMDIDRTVEDIGYMVSLLVSKNGLTVESIVNYCRE